MTDTQLAKEICSEIRAAHKKTCLPFTLEVGEPGLTDSKMGGTPYLPRGEAWPVCSYGAPMTFLAQIDCTQLKDLPDFPHAGLLQFFIGTDDVYGADFDDQIAQLGYQVFYRETVDPSVTPADVALPRPSDSRERYTPLGDRPCRIVFGQPQEQELPEGDHLFEMLFLQAWNQRRPEKHLNSIWDFYGLFPKEERDYDIFTLESELKTGHRMDGYPFFTQNDPRSEDIDYREFDTLLFQLDSEMRDRRELVCWGDLGVGNFFINREALKRRDFSRVLYNWDCG
jgi:uncharacterized protein YwqG